MATFGVNLFSILQAITGQNVVIKTVAICKSTLVVCFAHLFEVMVHDCLVCAHYNRRTFYRLLIENEGFPSRDTL